MSEKQKFSRNMLTGNEKPPGGVGEAGVSCGVSKEQFPYDGKCCDKGISKGTTVYIPRCPNCIAIVSMPDNVALKVNHILECDLFFYAKRLK